jgi:hypothetical protein
MVAWILNMKKYARLWKHPENNHWLYVMHMHNIQVVT